MESLLLHRILIGLYGFLFACVLLGSPNANAQTIVFDPDPPVVSPLQRLTIGDLDFQNTTTPKWLFTIGLRTSDGSAVRVGMRIRVSINLPGGESYPNAALIETIEPHFEVPGQRTITNLDIGRSIPTGPTQYDPIARARIEQLALPGGTLPAGAYMFNVEVSIINSVNPVRTTTFGIDIINPSSVELLFPLDGDNAVGHFPLFQWRFDGGAVRFALFQRLPGQTSLEEATTGTPHLAEELNGSSFQYPQGSVRSLEAGKTYVWFIEGLVPESGGTRFSVRSPLRSFTVSDDGISSLASLLDQLEEALGVKYKNVFDQIRAATLSPDGGMRLNGTPLTASDLARLIQQIRSNPNAVRNVILE